MHSKLNTIRQWIETSIPLFLLFVAVSYALIRWSLYFILPFFLVIILLPLLAILTLVLIPLLLICRRTHSSPISLKIAFLLSIIFCLIGWYAAVYSKQYAIDMADHFASKLPIHLALESRKIQMDDMFSDIAPPRHVQSTYVVLDDIHQLSTQLRSAFDPIAGWTFISKTDTKFLNYKVSEWGYFCSQEKMENGKYRYNVFDNSVILDADDRLIVTLYYTSRAECKLADK